MKDLRAALLQLFRDNARGIHGDMVDGHVVLLIDLAQAQVARILYRIAPSPAQELDEDTI